MTLLLFLFVTTTMVQAYVVPTGSMENNILVGDHMLVEKVGFENGGNNWSSYVLPHREVKRGDIVAFRYPEDVRQTFVKRVIGVAGDHIRLDNKQVIRNGQKLEEPYARYGASYRRLSRQLSDGAGFLHAGRRTRHVRPQRARRRGDRAARHVVRHGR